MKIIKNKIKKHILFLNEYKKNIIKTGAIAESSKYLAKKIVEYADLKGKRSIVELGPGTGIFTKYILEEKEKNAVFFSLEINNFFAKTTQEKYPKSIIYNDDANHIKKYLEKNNLSSTKCVISGLPWSCFNKKNQEELIENIYNSLEEGGKFVTFAYVQSTVLPNGINFKKLIGEKFKKVIKSEIIWQNVPPAFIYICEK